MFAIAMAVLQDGLSAQEVLRNIPHDGAAIFVYVLVLGFIVFIVHGSRQKTN